jgi:hypothetical protein
VDVRGKPCSRELRLNLWYVYRCECERAQNGFEYSWSNLRSQVAQNLMVRGICEVRSGVVRKWYRTHNIMRAVQVGYGMV